MQLGELASASVPTPQISNSTLVNELDIFILFIILFFSLSRALVYIANNRSEVFQGYVLHSATQFRTYRSPPGMTLLSTEKQPPEPIPSPESAAGPKQPWHFPMYFSLRHYAVLLMAGYTAAVFYAAIYGSNPFTHTRRVGWVIASQIPFVYAFATKNNVIGLLVGVGYEKLNYLHRHVGRLMVIMANVHAIGHVYKWSLAGDISQMIALPFVRWGIVALVCINLLGFFSIQYVRTKSYNLFFGTHVVGLIVMLFAACYHRQACLPYVIAGSVFYGVDHIIRAVKTRFATATLRTIPELGLTRVGIPSLNTGWRPGQHIRLRVLSTAMGLWEMTEVHPFTIASASNTEEGLVLMCKRTGHWTRKLYEMAQTSAFGEQSLKSDRRVQVMVEGPYGGVGDITIPNHSGTMFVVGGSGVTFALSAVQDLLLAGDRSRTEVIEVIWSIPDPAALETFIPLFATLVSRSAPARLRISIFYTRVTSRSFKELLLPPGITLTPGRPKIGELLDRFVTSMMVTNKDDTHGAFVAVCGPVSLAQDVALTVRALDVNSKKAIGGIQFHEEVFAW